MQVSLGTKSVRLGMLPWRGHLGFHPKHTHTDTHAHTQTYMCTHPPTCMYMCVHAHTDTHTNAHLGGCREAG